MMMKQIAFEDLLRVKKSIELNKGQIDSLKVILDTIKYDQPYSAKCYPEVFFDIDREELTVDNFPGDGELVETEVYYPDTTKTYFGNITHYNDSLMFSVYNYDIDVTEVDKKAEKLDEFDFFIFNRLYNEYLLMNQHKDEYYNFKKVSVTDYASYLSYRNYLELMKRKNEPDIIFSNLSDNEILKFLEIYENPEKTSKLLLTKSKYLHLVRILYSSINKTMSPEDSDEYLYSRYADGRNGGLLNSIDTTQGFTEWFNSKERSGCHPFEIVYGEKSNYIHLDPIITDENMYHLHIGTGSSLDAIPNIIKMALELHKNDITCKILNLEKIIKILKKEGNVLIFPKNYTLNNNISDDNAWVELFFSEFEHLGGNNSMLTSIPYI
jgi:hypothetical protein